MKHVLACLALFLTLVTASFADDGGDARAPAFQQVIESQLNAFKADDAAAAYAFAAPSIQKIFPSQDIFMGMVRSQYPQVYRPGSYRFLDIITDGAGRPAQKVLIISSSGKPYMALYSMEQQPDGSWKIAGCVILEAGTTA